MKSTAVAFLSLLPAISFAAKMNCNVESTYQPKRTVVGVDTVQAGDKGGALIGLRATLNNDGKLEVTFSTDRYSSTEMYLEIGRSFKASVPGELQVYQIDCKRTE